MNPVDYRHFPAPAFAGVLPGLWNNTLMNLLKSLAAVSSMTMFSRVLGFARDAIVARIFGAGWRPTPFSLLLNSRTFCGVFLLKALSHRLLCRFWRNIKASRVKMRPGFCRLCSGLLTLVLALVTVAGMLAAPWVILSPRRDLPIRPKSSP
jgi:putative peptidoglycan lipid II flippase